MSATFIIVNNGVDEVETEAGRPLVGQVNDLISANDPANGARLNVRIFVSGRPEGLKALQEAITYAILEVNLSSPTQTDCPALNEEGIMLYTEAKLNDMAVFRASGDDEVLDLKDRIKIYLGSGLRGDYFTLNSKLAEVQIARTVAQVEDILKRANEDRADTIARDIDQLNIMLAPHQIKEINDLLMWAIAAFRSLRFSILEAMLRLRARTTRPLVPFRQRIEERYSKLIMVDADHGGGGVVKVEDR